MSIHPIYTQKELVSRLLDGDEAAFEYLYNEHVVAVSRIVFRIVSSESFTRDIVQEVFLKFWLSRHKLEQVDDLSLYLYRIAYNSSFDHIRKERRHEAVNARMGPEAELLVQGDEVMSLVDFRETSRLITCAVNNLPSRSREIYVLNRSKGLKPHEIAAQLGLSVQSVRNSLTRSAKMIRDYLEQQGISLPLLLLMLPLPDLLG